MVGDMEFDDICSIISHKDSVSDTFRELKITNTKLRFEVMRSYLS
jgi:hypothetical protein